MRIVIVRHLLAVGALLFGYLNNASAQVAIHPFIGHDESAAAEYLLGRPSSLAVDDNGNVFLADELSMDVKVYDSDGIYIRTIGSRGSAPGQFQAITTVGIYDRSRLLVYDGQLSRVTIFDHQGLVLDTFSVDRSELIWPRSVIDSPATGEVIFLSKMPDHPSRRNDTVNSWIHVYDRLSFNKKYQFGQFVYDLPEDERDFANAISQSHPGNGALLIDNRFVVSQGIFPGELHIYEKEQSRWHEVAKVATNHVATKIVELLEENDTVAGSITTKKVNRATMTGLVNVQSAGLFGLESGGFVQFVFISEGGSGELVADRYDAAGRLVKSHQVFSGVDRSWHSRPIIYAHAQLSDSQYLIINISSYQPVVQKVDINW